MTSAFCPGHISCIFEPRRADATLDSGSRGVGICLSLGATADVERSAALNLTINGETAKAPVTAEALRIMGAHDLDVDIRTDLPMSQGFAMSAAGTVAACLAYASIEGMTTTEAFNAAHIAELIRGGGMGDVAGIIAGGVSVRLQEGVPPYGSTRRLDLDGELLLTVLGPPLRTDKVLADDGLRPRIEEAGAKALEAFLRQPGWGPLFQESLAFSRRSGVLSAELEYAIDELMPYGEASMCMLGNSLFFRGDIEAAKVVLDGPTWVCGVDTLGPRLL